MMFRSISMTNVLSFGPDGSELRLEPLNVLVGPNGSGKSNVLEVMWLLSRLPVAGPETSLPIIDWIWKGGGPESTARLEVVVDGIDPKRAPRLRHLVEFGPSAQRFSVHDEAIEDSEATSSAHRRPFAFFMYDHGNAYFARPGREDDRRSLRREELDPERSVLAQRNDREAYPEIAHFCAAYEGIRVYRDINFGSNSPTRQPQRTDLPTRALLESGANLGLILNRLNAQIHTQRQLLKYLKKFYAPAERVDVHIQGGTAQIYITEANWTTPATRLSDGTMRWLTLLAILLDPTPPKLVCLDEPDLGLHPDVLPTLADLLLEASERMQIVLTTHSDVLVDALSDHPEYVVVCEKHDGATSLRRLDRNELAVWLKKYSLGELWNSGQIGGRRF